MNKIKITDLEKFVKQHIKNPYLSMLEDMQIDTNVSLDNAVQKLLAFPDWGKFVLDRIYGCGIWFPEYINHHLVVSINWYINDRKLREGRE